MTGDRAEFLGRNGTLRAPAALRARALSDRTGAGLDPCGAVQVSVDARAGTERDASSVCSARRADADGARALSCSAIASRRGRRGARRAHGVLGRPAGHAARCETPDRALDLMLNRWLLYQTLACRIWGRSAFYQSSGAFGFRDQLQDVLALLHAAPQLAREHMLHAASRQFVEGDVQHWWHEPGGQGVRTRFSDDRLWLAVRRAALRRGDRRRGGARRAGAVPRGRPLDPDEHEAYERAVVSRRDGIALRALRARHRREPARPARTACR